jgi:U3 small nucleolar RNA-associated protein 4
MVKWNIGSVEPQSSSKVNGGGLWDLDFIDNTVYLACDDGRLRSYYLESGELIYRQRYQRQNCKLLSVEATTQAVFVGGSDGGIYKYIGAKPTAALRIASSAAVLCLAVLDDLTVVSGDSDGSVKFWEGKYGTLLTSFTDHEADILALVAVQDSIYASGVDSKVVKFSLTDDKWVLASKARGQSHDVRALAWTGVALISGGVTSDICIYPDDLFASEGEMRWSDRLDAVVYKRKRVRHIATLTYTSSICTGKTAEVLVTAFNNSRSVKVWTTDQLAKRVTKAFNFKPSGAAAVTSRL